MLMDVNEAAAFLKCSASTLNHWRIDGKGPKHSKVAGKFLYHSDDLSEYVEKLKVDPEAKKRKS